LSSSAAAAAVATVASLLRHYQRIHADMVQALSLSRVLGNENTQQSVNRWVRATLYSILAVYG